MARRVFLSYAHESEEHRALVRSFWSFLRNNGVDAVFDQVAEGERQDWALWMADQIRDAEVVLCVASPQYRLRSQQQAEGNGVRWEARLIRAEFYASGGDLQKFVPVVLPGQSPDGVPDFLAPAITTVYTVRDLTVPGAEDLLRFILRKPKLVEPPVLPEPDFDTWTPETVEPAPPVTDQVVSPNIGDMTPVVGRDQELADLRAAFTAPKKSRAPVVRILTGMGGVGKSSLARAYAERHLDDYGVVWWIHAEDKVARERDYRDLLDLVRPASEAALVRNPVHAVNTWLSELKQPWLLILDNVPTAAALNGLVPARGNGHVLVTSQAGRWPKPDTVHRVEPLETSAAVELLTTTTEDTDADTAAELADELGGLPLALTQAAAFTATTGIGLADYLRFYRDRSADLQADNQPDDYPHTVATTWLLAIERLSPLAREVLDTIAYLAPDAIPTSVLHPLADDELTLVRAIGELLSHSLITRGTTTTITVHRLVQSVTRHRDGLAHATRARDLVAAALPRPILVVDTMTAWQDLHAHVLAVVGHLPDDPEAFELRFRVAQLYDDLGLRRIAVVQAERLLEDAEPALGGETALVLRVRGHLAFWTRDGDESRARLEEVLAAQVALLGVDHPEVLDTRHDIATSCLELDEYESAKAMFAEVASARARVLGASDYRTLVSRSYVADVLAEMGQIDDAIALYETVLADAAAEFGEISPQFIDLQSEYADHLGRRGDPATARDMYTVIVQRLADLRGEYDPLTVGLHLPWASWTAMAGNPQKAGSIVLRMLVILRKSLSKQSPLVKQFEEGLRSIKNGQGMSRQTGKRRR
ncbi:tetratricopeptide repeat protein [Actinokineospora diospyrosa]|uniref:Tetratricopeptide repeat-containing protein n=1 Tax=Actinokineospora diospyrosa TaxID=103728 RepID=A0ABT1INT8_9PSEU|nr:tetratricopeptide repeat protein [Actinokineospora diospyrosa]MCP2274333.1 Tetratricopeptide repeat-containing protein [Actinokineospora diospyrosa]